MRERNVSGEEQESESRRDVLRRRSASGREADAKGRGGKREIRSRVFQRLVHQGVGKQGRSTSGSTPVVHDGNALVSMQTGRTPPYLTHNRILTWEVADADSPSPVVVPFPAPSLFLSPPRGPWTPFLLRRRRWDRDRDRDFDRVYETCLRHPTGSPAATAAAVVKERLFRSISDRLILSIV